MDRAIRIEWIARKIFDLNDRQLGWIERIVRQFGQPIAVTSPNSSILDHCMLEGLGDALLVHHCFSEQPFTKEQFEFVFVNVAKSCGHTAERTASTYPGHDITMNGVRYSLKTQADRSIRSYELHISKFMELGKGLWRDSTEDLRGLTGQFMAHLEHYDRILSLRCLRNSSKSWFYELVEIPKSLLQEAKTGELTISETSRQSPKPGYCTVLDATQTRKYQLYFDGGTERKLQIKHLDKSLCVVHATWEFPKVDLYANPEGQAT